MDAMPTFHSKSSSGSTDASHKFIHLVTDFDNVFEYLVTSLGCSGLSSFSAFTNLCFDEYFGHITVFSRGQTSGLGVPFQNLELDSRALREDCHRARCFAQGPERALRGLIPPVTSSIEVGV